MALFPGLYDGERHLTIPITHHLMMDIERCQQQQMILDLNLVQGASSMSA